MLQSRGEPHLEASAVAEVLAVEAEHLQRLALDAGHLVQPNGARHDLLQLRRRDRFDEVAKHAVFHGADRAFDRGPAGHEHERYVEIVLAHGAQKLESVHLGHRDVADDDVEVSLACRGRGRLAVEGDLDRETGGAPASARRRGQSTVHRRPGGPDRVLPRRLRVPISSLLPMH